MTDTGTGTYQVPSSAFMLRTAFWKMQSVHIAFLRAQSIHIVRFEKRNEF